MKPLINSVCRAIVVVVVGFFSGVGSVNATGERLHQGQLVKISPDGLHVGYVEVLGDRSLLWVSPITNPENRRAVTTWTPEDVAFDWADDSHLAIARRAGVGTALSVLPMDGQSDPVTSPVLQASFVALTKDTINSVVITTVSAETEHAMRYDAKCECFEPVANNFVKVSETNAKLDDYWVWSTSWDGKVVLVSRGDPSSGATLLIYSPNTRVTRPLFSDRRQ